MRVEYMSNSQLVNELLKKSMDASSYRSRVISNNIANYNTPGYKRHYVTFEETLKDNLNNINMKLTKEKHINNGFEFGQVKEEIDDSTSMRTDGNNVDIDNEMVNNSANALMYNALVTQVNNRLATTRYIINGR
ncbi:flagellar basal body rod protein FlgB [Clostridium tepidum]|jgi:flagellar basal-body rod protein FlgB|uniref:Flagellar basal body rod protein FlgB n=1 Tax=Clostridium tepidum TaxID=1962263 RepID=A0A1S9IHI9_9CLOT|nr:flagellar basal body rod protein FlgB [Clostridium tepidum]MCR1933661.1 flagellar basal body rod protein FlgB [Clostridium tepidum]MDU6876826.1 flagellar basal body rod protein FlgB [Clostridium botulinum]OOO63590.1 flagellar basal-body rod protein FlgB [Clostridium tepidum]OOO69738.1 flagellar basal-body rod protein FlgB [Clostridium tepidum]